jgi:uridine kinase
LCSGKTTFSHKLCAYLKNLGIESQPLSVDHYYYELDEQPVFKRTGSR